MNIKQHLELLDDGYDGYIGIYIGPDHPSFIKGKAYLIQEDESSFVCAETPTPYEFRIGHMTTWCTCVGVPKGYFERIYT